MAGKRFLFARCTFAPLFNLWAKEVIGLENLPRGRGFLIAPNHCSYIEHLLLGANVVPLLRKKIYFIAKKEHFEDMTQSLWHSFWGRYADYIPIDREAKGADALKTARDVLQKGNVVVIYPEGTRSLTGKIQKGKTGVVRLALQANVPIVPCGFKGTFEILPKGKSFPRFRRAKIAFGKPLSFEGYQGKPITKSLLRELTDRVMEEIARLSDQTYEAKGEDNEKE